MEYGLMPFIHFALPPPRDLSTENPNKVQPCTYSIKPNNLVNNINIILIFVKFFFKFSDRGVRFPIGLRYQNLTFSRCFL